MSDLAAMIEKSKWYIFLVRGTMIWPC